MQLSFTNQSTGCSFVKYLTDLVWYLDPHWSKLKEQVGFKPPQLFRLVYSSGDTDVYSPFNDYRSRHKPQPQLSKERLRTLAAIG